MRGATRQDKTSSASRAASSLRRPSSSPSPSKIVPGGTITTTRLGTARARDSNLRPLPRTPHASLALPLNPTLTVFLEYFSTPEGAAGTRSYDEFYDRAAKGTLPAFSFVIPRIGGNKTTGEGSNDDHPCHDVRLGEKLIKQTYEAVRAGPGWNRTMLFITYDDTGGWYDHADVPTAGVPRPEDSYSMCGATMDTNWLGMRAPALLISPWISAGRVIHDPAGPTPTSKYEHSSLLSALKTIFDLPDYLTRRDAWAGDLSMELDLTAPRTDCPMHLPAPPTDEEMDEVTRELLAARHPTHVSTGSGGPANDPAKPGDLTVRQRRRIRGLARAIASPFPDLRTMTHAMAEEWIQRAEARHREMSTRDEL